MKYSRKHLIIDDNDLWNEDLNKYYFNKMPETSTINKQNECAKTTFLNDGKSGQLKITKAAIL